MAGRQRLLVCGSRDWTDSGLVFAKLDDILAWAPRLTIIEGCCRGADAIAEDWTAERMKEGRDVQGEHFPYLKQFGRAGGPIRNSRMLAEGRPTMALAFHPDLEKSKGTADMVRKARAAGVSVTVIRGR